MVTVIVGVIALVLNSLKKRRGALILAGATVLTITAFVVASGFLEAARTNEMLRAADALAVPEGFRFESVLRYTNSNVIGCEASGKLKDFDAEMRLPQTRGDEWRLSFMLDPER